LGVLCGHRGELARPGQLGNGGGVADGVYLGVAGHGQVLVDHQPTALGLQANLVDEWVGPYADAPDQGARRDDLAVGQRDTVRGRLAHGHAGAYVDPAGAQDRVGRARQPRVQLRQDSLREVQQQPPGTGAQPRVPGVEDVGVQNLLRGDLGAGVARADHDERDAGGALDGVVGLVGQLDLRGHVVAQVQRLGDAPKAVGVFVGSRYVQQLVDAADGEHEPVVAQSPRRSSGSTKLRRRALRSMRSASPIRRAPGRVSGSETATRRGSITPAATSGSSGRYRK
jgi:hypothetical protein